MAGPTQNHTGTYRERVQDAAAALRPREEATPRVGLWLGPAAEALTDVLEEQTAVSCEDLPGFPGGTNASQRLLFGRLEGVPVVAVQGGLRVGEGHSAKEVAFTVRVLATLGLEALLIADAAGGMRPHHERGDLLLVTDHINLQGDNPLIGPNEEAWGPRFPDVSEPYDPALRALAREQAERAGVTLREGVYCAVAGPALGTTAEHRFMRDVGGDVVGTNTVPEVLAARHMDVRCLAFTVITDECHPEAPASTAGQGDPAKKAISSLRPLVRGVVREMEVPRPREAANG